MKKQHFYNENKKDRTFYCTVLYELQITGILIFFNPNISCTI